MPTLAFIGQRYQEQLETNPEALSGAEVLWAGTSLDAFRAEGLSKQPQVLVLDMEQLGDDPRVGLDRLLAESRAELIFISYPYARREVLDSLQGERTRILQGMPSLSAIRSQMLSLIIRDILGQGSGAKEAASPSPRGPEIPDPVARARDTSWATCPQCGERVPADCLA